MTLYVCIRCNKYETKIFCDIKRHCLRHTPCKKRNDVMLISEDQQLIMTLMPYYNNSHSIEYNDLDHLSNSNIISKNRVQLFNELDNIIKNNIKICKYCNEEFESIYLLRKHTVIKCFYDNLKNNYDLEDKTIINSSFNNTINNNNVTNNITNITNNSNYNIFFDLPVPFEDDWDLSKITKSDKSDIMVSQYVFSKLLSEILNNDKNSNVIIDKDDKSTTGMVYLNHKRQYIIMSKKDIVSKSMDKLYDNAFNIVDSNKDCTKIIKEMSKDYIHNKYNQFVSDVEHKDEFNEYIIDIFDKNKNTAICKYKQVIDLKALKKIQDNNALTVTCIKNNDNKDKTDKTEIISKRSVMDNLMKKRDEDLYYFYDSDGNSKI